MQKTSLLLVFKSVLGIVSIVLALYILDYIYNIHITQKQSLLLNNENFMSVENESISMQQEATANNNTIEDISKKIEKNDRMLKIEELQKENPELIGWLEIPNTIINYPVLQGKDNSFYVNHNYQKEKKQSGSIFIDADFNFDPRSTNMIIYGHNMKNGTMFTSLINYKNKAYYESHPYIRFTTTTTDTSYEIISVFESKVYEETDTNSFKYYNFINAKNNEEYDNFVSNIKKLSIYDTGKTAINGENLITLSTCAYHTKNGRFAVVAKEKSN